MAFYENYVKLCNLAGKSPSAVAVELKLGKPSVTRWKHGAVPRDTTILKIAGYFGVSVEWLEGKTDDPGIKKERPADGEALNVDEWIKKARTMSNGDLNLALRELLKIQAERIAEDERTEH